MPKRSRDQVDDDSSTAILTQAPPAASVPPLPSPFSSAQPSDMGWRKIPVSLAELCIDTTLRCGQSFRWRKSDDEVWSCALHGRLFSLKQDSANLYYKVHGSPAAVMAAATAKKTGRAGAASKTARAANTPKKRKAPIPLTPPVSHADSDADDTKSSDPSLLPSSSAPSTKIATTTRSFIADSDAEAFLRHYLNLSPDLSALYAQWSAADKNFAAKAPRFTGVRILRQDAWEALVGFICSSNNNIARISQMMEKLCVHYGRRVGRAGDASAVDGGGVKDFYDMPDPAALAHPSVEAHLRELGFGYRAKYLYRTAAMIVEDKGREDGEEEEETKAVATKSRARANIKSEEPDGNLGLAWLDGLRNPETPSFFSGKTFATAGELPATGGRPGYRAAHESLLDLQGVGPKVADCVCLMGLGWGESVPVDTHVWQIAVRDYRLGKGVAKGATMTKATYDAVGDHFRKLWGKEAGWAHSVLFTADLRQFAERLRAKIEVQEEQVVVKTEAGVGEGQVEDVKTEVLTTVKTEVVEPLSMKTEEQERDAEGDGDSRALVIEEKTTLRTTRAKRRRRG